jgi:hypothetical protein
MEWSGTEVSYLRRNAERGARCIAEELGRSVASVERQAYRLRVSLRRAGSRRGAVLGQPRGVPISRLIRESVVSGQIPAEALDARIALGAGADLCPGCGVREIAVASSGLCRPCHLRRLAAAHRDALADLAAEADAMQELWTCRQQVKRAKQARDMAAGA